MNLRLAVVVASSDTIKPKISLEKRKKIYADIGKKRAERHKNVARFPLKLTFRMSDDSGKARGTVRVYSGGTAIGGASMIDFKRFCTMVRALEDGVYLNIGSAVLLPEIFVKALTLVRNLGSEVSRFTTADMDFIRHYRPGVNVVSRPTSEGGAGYRLTGPHEILVPLVFASVLESIGVNM